MIIRFDNVVNGKLIAGNRRRRCGYWFRLDDRIGLNDGRRQTNRNVIVGHRCGVGTVVLSLQVGGQHVN